jgi:prepilin-type N-terminal cleavage/methylation domain-containing protein/prepilin-type processing-associated H-X9-DG protein
MKSDSMNRRARPTGFTLTEILVAIVIIILLATISIALTRNMLARAASATAMSNLRQSGSILVSNALEKNNRFSFFSGGASGGFDERAYNIVRAYLGNPQAAWNNQIQNRADIMHWNPKKLPPGNFHWDCFAINFTDVRDFGVVWEVQNGRPDGSNGRVLYIPTVSRPESYPILIDSSTAAGKEIFRVGVVATELPGMRNNGKANAFFLDGSAKALDRQDLKAAGFTKAYDNRTTPPVVINL